MDSVTSEHGASAITLPHLFGPRVTLRPGSPADAPRLRAILAEPQVARWWGEPEAVDYIAAKLAAADGEVLLVIEVDGEVAGGIEFHEENEPAFRHAGIDIYLAASYQRRGFGTEAVRLLAGYLIDEHGHHRLTIDPALANAAAIRCYERVGFRAVGVLRQYWRDPEGVFQDGLLMDLLAGELSPL